MWKKKKKIQKPWHGTLGGKCIVIVLSKAFNHCMKMKLIDATSHTSSINALTMKMSLEQI